MRQSDIMDSLLRARELALGPTTLESKMELHGLLAQMFNGISWLPHERVIGIEVLLERAYWDAVGQPDALPYLFPFFALACGDRRSDEDLFAAEIDWAQMADREARKPILVSKMQSDT